MDILSLHTSRIKHIIFILTFTIISKTDEFKLFIVVPLIDGNCVIGRTDKFISPKTVKTNTNAKQVLIENGPYAYVSDRKIYFSD